MSKSTWEEMRVYKYCFKFEREVDFIEAKETLQLSLLAASGLFGEASVLMDVWHGFDRGQRAIFLHGRTHIAEAVCKIFIAFAIKEFGDDSFSFSVDCRHKQNIPMGTGV